MWFRGTLREAGGFLACCEVPLVSNWVKMISSSLSLLGLRDWRRFFLVSIKLDSGGNRFYSIVYGKKSSICVSFMVYS